MSSSAPAFKAINFDIVKKVVKDVSTEQNIPKLIFPADAPAPVATPEPLSPPMTPVAVTSKPETASRAKRSTRQAGAPAPLVRAAVDLPDYLLKAIGKESVEKGVTRRFLYLIAFRAAGFNIHDIDMQEDGRRDSAA